jgi:hypothetical protein
MALLADLLQGSAHVHSMVVALPDDLLTEIKLRRGAPTLFVPFIFYWGRSPTRCSSAAAWTGHLTKTAELPMKLVDAVAEEQKAKRDGRSEVLASCSCKHLTLQRYSTGGNKFLPSDLFLDDVALLYLVFALELARAGTGRALGFVNGEALWQLGSSCFGEAMEQQPGGTFNQESRGSERWP